jgi:hypothetical protein
MPCALRARGGGPVVAGVAWFHAVELAARADPLIERRDGPSRGRRQRNFTGPHTEPLGGTPADRGARGHVLHDDGRRADRRRRRSAHRRGSPPQSRHSPILNDCPVHGPVLLEAPAVRSCARPLVVDEYHAGPYEHRFTDRHAVADEGIALDLAARADRRSALDLGEGPDARAITDPAAVQVRE